LDGLSPFAIPGATFTGPETKIKPKGKKYEIHYQLPFIYQVLVCHLLKTSAWQKHLAAQKLSSSGWEWEWEWHHDPRRGY